MLHRIIHVCIVACLILGGCQKTPERLETVSTQESATHSTRVLSDQLVEASCGQCQFEMDGSGCDLAIRVDGKSYLVDGTGIDDHGDAHGDEGLCNCIRKAKVSGEIKDGRFLASKLELQATNDGSEVTAD